MSEPATPESTAPPRAPIGLLWTAVLCGYLALGASLQTLPALVQQRFHGGPVAVGIAVGIAFAATATGRPFAGRAGDAGLSRRTVLLGGGLVALGGLGQFLAPDLALLLLARIVLGFGEAALFSGALPWVLSGSRGRGRGRVAGWFGLSMWSGLAAGPAVAAALAARFGPDVVWWGVIGAGLAAAALVAGTPRVVAPGSALAMLRAVRWRELVPAGAGLPGLGLGLAAYGYGTISALLVLFLRADALGGDGIALAGFAVAFLLTRAVGSPLVDRHEPALVAAAFLAVAAVGLALIAAAEATFPALLGTALAGVGLGLVYPATVALTLRRTTAPDAGAGAAVGAMTSYWDLGIMAAGPIGGLLAAGPGYRVSFVVAAVTGVLAGATLTAVRRARPSRSSSVVPHEDPVR